MTTWAPISGYEGIYEVSPTMERLEVLAGLTRARMDAVFLIKEG